MHIFIKLWNPKPVWLAMDLQARQNYIKRAQQGMVKVSEMGLETIAWFEIENKGPPFNTDYCYCSIYKAKDQKHIDEFHKAMNQFGWYEYFEQINVTGKGESPGAVLERILKLPQEK